MNQINLAFAFGAGLLATVNPCGWAMLPAFVSYYLGTREEGYNERPLYQRALEGLQIGLLITLGFVLVFGLAAAILSAGLHIIVRYLPIAAVLVGIALVFLGLWLLFGKTLPFKFVGPDMELRQRTTCGYFLYGIAYALASLSCTLPIFIAVVSSTLTLQGAAASATMLGAYAAGMATVLMTIAVSIAVLKGAVAKWFQKILPFVNKIGAISLIIAGGWIVWYQTSYLAFL